MMEKLSTDVLFVRDNLSRIEQDIVNACLNAGRSREEVTLMAVTKTVDADRINTALRAGVTCIGENRVQEFLGKKDSLFLDGISTHLIGHLQTNKVKQIVGEVDMIQSVDRLSLAQMISEQSIKRQIITDVLVEINIGNEDSKSGIDQSKLTEFICQLAELPAIRVRGLMCIPPISDTEAEKRQYFYAMRKLFVDIRDKKVDNILMDILSMGMSSDYQEAILEGSTMIRVGTALFGQRFYP